MHEAHRLAVRPAELVGVVQRGRGVGAEPGDHRRRQPVGLAVEPEQLAGVDAVDVLHRDEVVGVDLSEVVDVDDVRVGQLRGELGFAEEHLEEVGRIGEVRQDPLDRDAAIEAFEPALLCEKHLGHPSARDASQEHVLAEPDAGGAIGSHATILPLMNRLDHAATHCGNWLLQSAPDRPAPCRSRACRAGEQTPHVMHVMTEFRRVFWCNYQNYTGRLLRQGSPARSRA